MVKVAPGTHLKLQAEAKVNSQFTGWSFVHTVNQSDLSKEALNSDSTEVVAQVNEKVYLEIEAQHSLIIYANFDLIGAVPNLEPVSIAIDNAAIPRVMFWFGKVNQHWNLDKEVWETDADGVSGARENKLEYCQKYYPTTKKVVEYKMEKTDTWKDAGNRGNYISNKMSYRCVLANQSVAGPDVSNQPEKPNAGSICYYFPELPLCLPLNDPNAQRYAGVSVVTQAVADFVDYGADDNTISLGQGERAAVINSYQTAFKQLPRTDQDLADIINIANGHWPTRTSLDAEQIAQDEFQKIYKKVPDMSNQHDAAAITVMAYGLRQRATNRNLYSEQQGINTFQHIYQYLPFSTKDWNIVQAISYSGATREKDSDGDLLPDTRESILGTDVNNRDSDGDGYLDGAEMRNGHDPLRK